MSRLSASFDPVIPDLEWMMVQNSWNFDKLPYSKIFPQDMKRFYNYNYHTISPSLTTVIISQHVSNKYPTLRLCFVHH